MAHQIVIKTTWKAIKDFSMVKDAEQEIKIVKHMDEKYKDIFSNLFDQIEEYFSIPKGKLEDYLKLVSMVEMEYPTINA